jgi:hypothetical protein
MQRSKNFTPILSRDSGADGLMRDGGVERGGGISGADADAGGLARARARVRALIEGI